MHKRHTWAAFADDVLALYAPPIRRKATWRKLEHVLREFQPLCRYSEDLTPSVVAAWIAAHPGRRPATVDSFLRSLRAACNYGMSAGYLRESPFAFRSPRHWVDWSVEPLPPAVHTAEEIARVLARADFEAQAGRWRNLRLRAVIYTAAFTGARKREILAACVADLQLDQGLMTIRPNARRPLKTPSSAAQIPLAPPLVAVLEGWVAICGSPWLFPGIRRQGPWLEGPAGAKALDQVKGLGLRAGVRGLTFQSFRHSLASLSEGWGIGELALQRLLRHSSPRTQEYYRHAIPAVLRDVAARIHFP